MSPHKRLIRILGGMGPAATIDFMSKIVAATPASADQDHVPLIVHDVSQIPDRSAAIREGSDAPILPMLSGVRLLDAAGVEITSKRHEVPTLRAALKFASGHSAVRVEGRWHDGH